MSLWSLGFELYTYAIRIESSEESILRQSPPFLGWERKGSLFPKLKLTMLRINIDS